MKRGEDSVSADLDCGQYAVGHVRKYGGVLEQPEGSRLFDAFDLPLPWHHDPQGGYTVKVEQVSWGHVARKPTWLYVVGVPQAEIEAGIRTGGTPTHWCSGGRRRSSGSGGLVPPGIKVCSAQQRRRTPRAFAEWLMQLARCVEMSDSPALTKP